jgi:lipid-binding SYLF domain-containing protein
MKTLLLGLLLLGFARVTWADDKADLDKRINALTTRLETLQAKPDKAIPWDKLSKAQGIILLERVKGGLVFGYEDGRGVAMVKDKKSHKWSAAAFMTSGTTSFGLQAGGEQSFYVVLLMTTNSAFLMTEPNFNFGGEARASAGNAHDGTDTTTNSVDMPIQVYDDRNGFYGGAVVKGGTLAPDDKANTTYYGGSFTMKDILFDKKVKATQPAIDLAAKLTELSKKPKN